MPGPSFSLIKPYSLHYTRLLCLAVNCTGKLGGNDSLGWECLYCPHICRTGDVYSSDEDVDNADPGVDGDPAGLPAEGSPGGLEHLPGCLQHGRELETTIILHANRRT